MCSSSSDWARRDEDRGVRRKCGKCSGYNSRVSGGGVETRHDTNAIASACEQS